MQETTRHAVCNLLLTFAKTSLKSYDLEVLKRAYPFHRLFFDETGMLAFKRERSVVTRMGKNLYPELAKLIASERFIDVEREKEIQGTLDDSTVGTIDRIVRDLRAKKRRPDHAQEIKDILSAPFNIQAGIGQSDCRPVYWRF